MTHACFEKEGIEVEPADRHQLLVVSQDGSFNKYYLYMEE